MADDPLVTEFLEESLDSLTELDEKIAELVNSTDIVTDVNEVFRPVHSIKGAASFFKLKGMMTLAHKLETLLDELRQFKREMTQELSEVLNRGFFILREVVQNGLDDDFELNETAEKFIVELEELLSGGENPEAMAKAIMALIRNGDDDSIIQVEEKINKILGLTQDDEEAGGEKDETLEKIEELLNAEISTPNPENVANLKIISEAFILQLEEKGAIEAMKAMKEFFEDFIALADSPVGVDEMLASVLFDKLDEVQSKLPSDKQEEGSVNTKKETQSKQKEEEKTTDKKSDKKAVRSESVRINVMLLEDIMNLMSELVLSRNQLNLHASVVNHPELTKTTQQVSSIMTELQSKVMKTRLQPVSTIFNPLPGVVREISRTLEKDVELVLKGKATELDRSVLESIKDPLTHIIRNSLDHGLEFPDERKELGKQGKATLTISAYHEGGMVVIEISDNGRGVNIDIVSRKALEKGLYTEGQIAKMTEQQKAEIIFNPGFSTAEQISQVSGRGVGMDVVKSNIVNLGGHVDLHSQMGKGTVLKLKIPLTLAIIPALIVETQGQRFAISQANLEEMVLLKSSEKNKIEIVRGVEVFRLRGEVLPLLRLNRVIGYSEIEKDEDDSINIIILSTGKRSFGLVVDKLHDIEEIVVKSLDDFFNNTPVFSGATILGDGSICLIFDILKMAELSGMKESETGDSGLIEDASGYISIERQVLIFSVNSQQTLGVCMDNVMRLEKVESVQIDRMSDYFYLRYRGGILPLISVWQVLDDPNFVEFPEMVNIIVFRVQNQEVGLLVRNIEDVVILDKQITTDVSCNPIYLGSVIVKQKVLSLLNLEHLAIHYTANGKRRENLLVYHTDESLNDKIDQLKKSGYDVTEVKSREEVGSVLTSQMVDVVVLDTSVDKEDEDWMSEQMKVHGDDKPVIHIDQMETAEYQEKLSEGQLSNALNEILQARLNS